MIELILGGSAFVCFLIVIILLYRGRAQQAEHFAAIQQTIAEAATAHAQHRQRLDARLKNLHEEQRSETIDTHSHLAERADFDNDWSGLPAGSGYVAPHSGPDAAGSSGAAGD